MVGTGLYAQRLNTYLNEPILAFLSRKGVFPRYGFPVDTVEMIIPSGKDSKKNKSVFGLQLSRDLAMAISEYAPGSQIVANGSLITSRYIRKVPNALWKQYDYKICPNCNSVIVFRENETEGSKLCPICASDLGGFARTFLIPEAGFMADPDAISKPGLVKPKRTYNNETMMSSSGTPPSRRSVRSLPRPNRSRRSQGRSAGRKKRSKISLSSPRKERRTTFVCSTQDTICSSAPRIPVLR